MHNYYPQDVYGLITYNAIVPKVSRGIFCYQMHAIFDAEPSKVEFQVMLTDYYTRVLFYQKLGFQPAPISIKFQLFWPQKFAFDELRIVGASTSFKIVMSIKYEKTEPGQLGSKS